MHQHSDLPWLVVGDCNEAMWSFEHFSYTPRPEQQMVDFRDTLEICELVDLSFVGVPYTYDNKRGGSANVKVRLDRAMATNEWRDIFGAVVVKHLTTSCSDHCPLLIIWEPETTRPAMKTRWYEVMWQREHSLPEVISSFWEGAGQKKTLGNIRAALSKMRDNLHKWSKEKFGNVTREIEKSRSRLEELINMNADRMDLRREEDKLNELLYREEMMCLQRSRIVWLKEGDRNTISFQSKAIWRAQKNKIMKLLDAHGV